jgi:hypothetical protein
VPSIVRAVVAAASYMHIVRAACPAPPATTAEGPPQHSEACALAQLETRQVCLWRSFAQLDLSSNLLLCRRTTLLYVPSASSCVDRAHGVRFAVRP